MPALLVHYTFCESVLPEEDLSFSPIVRLGTQGPDAFMAYSSIPWKKRERVEKVRGFGHALHRMDVGVTYWNMVQYALKSEQKDLLFAYIDGVLMHYCLDRIMHAYIFYRTGFDKKGQLKGYYSWSHGYFEAILDKEFATRKGTYRKLPDCIRCDENQVKEVSKMWKEASIIPLEEDDFYFSYLDFLGAEGLLWNPAGLKRPLFRLIGKYSVPYTQCHPKRMERFAKLDVLNEKKAKWLIPATGEVHDESVEEMFEKAQSDFKYVHSLIRRAYGGEDVEKEFKEFTKPLDHEGSPIGKRKYHYDLCWKVLGDRKYLPEGE